MKNRRTLILLSLLPFAVLYACAQAQPSYTDPDALAKLVREKTEPHVLVDVRTPDEYASGHIPTAVNIPVDVIGTKPPSGDPSSLVIVYCRSGNRSATAKKILEGLGFTRVVDFGAVSRWRGDLVTGDKP